MSVADRSVQPSPSRPPQGPSHSLSHSHVPAHRKQSDSLTYSTASSAISRNQSPLHEKPHAVLRLRVKKRAPLQLTLCFGTARQGTPLPTTPRAPPNPVNSPLPPARTATPTPQRL